MPEFMGVAEIASLLGVTRQRVNALLKSDPTFPPPVAELSAGRIWMGVEVRRWMRQRGRAASNRADIDGVLVIAVQGFGSIGEVGDEILADRMVVMETGHLPRQSARRCIDYVAGMQYATKAHIETVMDGAVLITPEGQRPAAPVLRKVRIVLAERRRRGGPRPISAPESD